MTLHKAMVSLRCGGCNIVLLVDSNGVATTFDKNGHVIQLKAGSTVICRNCKRINTVS